MMTRVSVPTQAPTALATAGADRTALLVIFLACLAITAWLSFAAARIEIAYLDHYGFFFDPAAYYLRNIRVFNDFNAHGLWSSVGHEIFDNGRCPLRTVPYLLFAPKQLVTPTGHMWTEAPLLFLFLLLFGLTVHANTRSLFFAIAAVGAFAGVRFLYDPLSGIGAYWLDFPAACAMSAAALCLIRYSATKQRGWMIGLGACLSATVLCRWSTTAYLGTFLAVALPAALYGVCRNNWMAVAKTCTPALIAALPGIIFVWFFWQINADYYRTFGFAFHAPVSAAVNWIFLAVPQIFGPSMLCAVMLFTGLSCWQLWQLKGARLSTLTCLWLPTSVFVFLAFLVKAVGGVHPYVYFAPALFVGAFCGLHAESFSRRQWLAASLALTIVGMSSAIEAYDTNRRLANSAPTNIKLAKECDTKLASLIFSTHSKTFAQFDMESATPYLEAFFTYGVTCKSLSLFSVHEKYLQGLYPGLDPKTMASTVCKDAQKTAALVAVFADPDYPIKPGVFNNAYSSTVSRQMSLMVADDTGWKFVANVQAPSGLLAVYKNLHYSDAPSPNR